MDPILEAVLAGASASLLVTTLLLFVGYRLFERALDAHFVLMGEKLRAETETQLEHLRSDLRLTEAEHLVRFTETHSETMNAARKLLANLSACAEAFRRAEALDSPEHRQAAISAASEYEASLHTSQGVLALPLLSMFRRAYAALYDWGLQFSPTLRVPRPMATTDPDEATVSRSDLVATIQGLQSALEDMRIGRAFVPRTGTKLEPAPQTFKLDP